MAFSPPFRHGPPFRRQSEGPRLRLARTGMSWRSAHRPQRCRFHKTVAAPQTAVGGNPRCRPTAAEEGFPDASSGAPRAELRLLGGSASPRPTAGLRPSELVAQRNRIFAIRWNVNLEFGRRPLILNFNASNSSALVATARILYPASFSSARRHWHWRDLWREHASQRDCARCARAPAVS